MDLAPIVLFVYKRPWHTEQTLKALSENDLADQSVLYVYSDSPKLMASEEDVRGVEEVRRLARSRPWCKEVHVIESPHNKGLVTSFVTGITEVVNKHDRIIVLEDDQVTSKGFLKFMNEALDLYKDDEKVMHVSGYMYPADFECRDTTFFLDIQTCPGWGTWKRAWRHYNHDAEDHYQYFSATPERKRKFDIEGNAYFFRQLEKNRGTQLYSWAVRWYASCSRAGGLVLFPSRSLVRNIGLDATGEHCAASSMYEVDPVDYLPIRRVPIVENTDIRKAVDEFYRVQLAARRGGPSSRSGAKTAKLKRLLLRAVRKPLRYAMRLAFPELSELDMDRAKRTGLRSSSHACQISEKARVKPPFHLNTVTVGDYTYIRPHADLSMVDIGKFCSIGPRFCAGGGIHPVEQLSTSPMFYSTRKQNGISLSGTNKVQERKPVTIGNDVFVGMNVTLLDGVTIGDGAVVGAGCVVSKDVPPYAIVAGNPMRILRYRFDEDIRAKLLAIKWWNWPEDRLQEVEKSFFDVEEFLRKAEGGKLKAES